MSTATEVYKGDKTLMPLCVATYDRHHKECNGDPEGADDEERMPCVYRDRCVAFGVYCRKNRADRSDLIQLVKGPDNGTYAIAKGDDAELQQLLVDHIKKYKIKDGVAAGAPLVTAGGVRPATGARQPAPRAEVPKPSSKPPRGTPRSLNTEGRAKVAEIGDHFQSMLLQLMKRTMADSHGEAAPGQLYMIDRRERSNYVALYAKTANGGKVAIASMYFKPNNGVLEVRCAVEYRAFVAFLSATNIKKLEPQDYTGRDGQFKVRLPKLDKMGVALVAEALARATQAGIIDLPACS